VEFNRNHYFMLGLILVMIGIQLRMVESYQLNEQTTQFLAARTGGAASKIAPLLPSVGPSAGKVIRPPDWIGWALMSIGSVLILHSFAMTKPEG
jgi:hypothetical protein